MADNLTMQLSRKIARRLIEAIHFSDDKRSCANKSNVEWMDRRERELAPLVAALLSPHLEPQSMMKQLDGHTTECNIWGHRTTCSRLLMVPEGTPIKGDKCCDSQCDCPKALTEEAAQESQCVDVIRYTEQGVSTALAVMSDVLNEMTAGELNCWLESPRTVWAAIKARLGTNGPHLEPAAQSSGCTCCNDLANIAAEFADAERYGKTEQAEKHRARYMEIITKHITGGHDSPSSSEAPAAQPKGEPQPAPSETARDYEQEGIEIVMLIDDLIVNVQGSRLIAERIAAYLKHRDAQSRSPLVPSPDSQIAEEALRQCLELSDRYNQPQIHIVCMNAIAAIEKQRRGE